MPSKLFEPGLHDLHLLRVNRRNRRWFSSVVGEAVLIIVMDRLWRFDRSALLHKDVGL